MKPEVTASSAPPNERGNGGRKQSLNKGKWLPNGTTAENLRNGTLANGGRSMSRMHPGKYYRVVEVMIATQLKGLGGRRNKECRPVATGCQLRHEKTATRS